MSVDYLLHVRPKDVINDLVQIEARFLPFLKDFSDIYFLNNKRVVVR